MALVSWLPRHTMTRGSDPVARKPHDNTVERVHVLVLPEAGHLVAQCLEYDIAAQGRTMRELREAFAQTFVAQVALAVEHGQRPLANLRPAPQRHWKLFERAEKLSPVLHIPAPSHPKRRASRLPRVPRRAQLAVA